MMTVNDIPRNKLLLYADDGYDSHVVRFLLEEKKIDYHHSFLESERPEDIAVLNPYKTLPIMVHADTVLYQINVIFEYVEERFRQHKILPEAPEHRAQTRQLVWRIQNDWLVLARKLLMHPDSFDKTSAALAKKKLSDSLITIAPLFTHKPFFLSNDFGLCDIIMVPLLWHLKQIDFELPTHLVRPLLQYQEKMFNRTSFQNSLKK